MKKNKPKQEYYSFSMVETVGNKTYQRLFSIKAENYSLASEQAISYARRKAAWYNATLYDSNNNVLSVLFGKDN